MFNNGKDKNIAGQYHSQLLSIALYFQLIKINP